MISERFTDEGPRDDQTRIIGVKLAVRDQFGNEHKLEMFQCQHTMPSMSNGSMSNGYWQSNNVRVTLHTSKGDVTLTGTMR